MPTKSANFIGMAAIGTQSKNFLLFLGGVALLGTLSSLWLPHWSGSLYVLAVLGYFWQGNWRHVIGAGSVMAVVWLGLALSWDLPNEGLLAERVGRLFGLPRWGLWSLTAFLGFLLGSSGIGLGQALCHLLPQKPPWLRAPK
ncbi:MAG: hypothetical protein RMJ49_02495 [Bacteroidia bacterium]|nr:hypothetical protein [Bacteroidia bacterium]